MDKGIAQFGGNEELYLSILGYYLEDLRPLLESAEAMSPDTLEGYAQTAHAIKGASRNVFVTDLGDEAERLEQAAKNGDSEYVSSHNAEFVGKAWKLVQDIEGMLSAKGLM